MSAHGMSDGLREAVESLAATLDVPEAGTRWIANRLRALLAAHPSPEADHDVCAAHADVIAQQRNSVILHGHIPDPDDNHTSDGRCKYPATCASEPPRSAPRSAARDIDALAAVLSDLPTDPWHYARLILASDWLAAREAAAAKAAGERALLDAADDAVPKFNVHPLNRSNTVADWLRDRAARIAREATRG